MIIAGTHSCLHGTHCPAGKCTTHYIVRMVDVPHTNPFFNTFVIVTILPVPPPHTHTHTHTHFFLFLFFSLSLSFFLDCAYFNGKLLFNSCINLAVLYNCGLPGLISCTRKIKVFWCYALSMGKELLTLKEITVHPFSGSSMPRWVAV